MGKRSSIFIFPRQFDSKPLTRQLLTGWLGNPSLIPLRKSCSVICLRIHTGEADLGVRRVAWPLNRRGAGKVCLVL